MLVFNYLLKSSTMYYFAGVFVAYFVVDKCNPLYSSMIILVVSLYFSVGHNFSINNISYNLYFL